MGSVAMGEGGTFYFDGVHITPIAYCVYCDRCGSFAIGRAITRTLALRVALAALVVTLFWYPSRASVLPGAWFACFIMLLLVLVIIGALPMRPRCRRCGNQTITRENVLQYADYDRRVLDIPYEQTVKYFVDNY